MNYNINVNQFAIVENCLNIDIIDAAIFDFYQKLYSSPTAKRMKSDSKYIEIKWDFVVKRLPILGIKTRQGVFNRMDKLCAAGLLERHPDSQKLNGSYFCPGEKHDLMFEKSALPVNETLQGCKPNFTAPVNQTLHAYKVDAIKDNALKNDAILLEKETKEIPSSENLKDKKAEKEKNPAQKEKEIPEEVFEEVINFLNSQTGRKFPVVEAYKKPIRARLKDGYTVENIKKAIEFMVLKWIKDLKMSIYLRPETLLGSKFHSYFAEAKAAGDNKQRMNGESDIAYLRRIGAYN